eukprot:12412338-Karenia_brevis.AAC.1
MAERHQVMCDLFNGKTSHAGAVVDEDGKVMDAVPMSTDEETRKTVDEAVESAKQTSDSLRIIDENTQKSQEVPLQKRVKLYSPNDKPWQGIHSTHLDFIATVVPADQPIDFDTISFADFHNRVKFVIEQDEADNIEYIECPC